MIQSSSYMYERTSLKIKAEHVTKFLEMYRMRFTHHRESNISGFSLQSTRILVRRTHPTKLATKLTVNLQ
jgi:hypothetical protein